ncbi:unnamed protein product [Rotaria sordida]|uniref:F-box domain-containing protein n=1 Tax=Rotaria sordida TaxID=392033 RepID=A0A819LNA1_9BILA|nr:unnamed protein product [Rotaria sordida]
MEQTKPQRRTIIFDYWNINKKKKLIEEPKISSKKSVTLIENFSNEIFYEIFNYLDVYYVYKAFYNLNIRLQNLLTNSTLPLKINISSMSKSIFQSYNRHIIMPNKHRIISLYLSNSFIVDIIFSPVRIASNFTRLETLIFDNIKSKYLINILNHLVSLPNLSSLIMIPIDCCRNPNEIYQHIFRLPVLKYCKISLKEYSDYYSLPIATNVISSIEHLVITHRFYLTNFNALLSYIPKIRRLTFHYLDGSHNKQLELFSCYSKHLTYVSINMRDINFDKFELMIKNLFHQLQILHITTNYDRTYFDANRWEQIILSSMPDLRIFDFQYINFIENNNNNQLIYNSIVNQFCSSFWFQRKWFFGYQFYMEEYQKYVIFYSINPYRRKQYTLYKQLTENFRSRHPTSHINSVDHVNIQDEEAIMNCVNYFRNATKLTLSHNFAESRVWLRIILKRIIPLKQLTTLIIDCDTFSFDQLIKLLHFTPNIHTLTFNSQSITESNSMLIQQSETFRLVSNTNKITNVTIKEKYSFENIKLFVALCPQMQNLTIDIYTQHLESIIRFILLKTKINIQHLCSIYIKNTRKSMIGILKTLIESEELLDNYLIKSIDSQLYLWW